MRILTWLLITCTYIFKRAEIWCYFNVKHLYKNVIKMWYININPAIKSYLSVTKSSFNFQEHYVEHSTPYD
jgi:hypothetical protein